jgi:hypothetical protein
LYTAQQKEKEVAPMFVFERAWTRILRNRSGVDAETAVHFHQGPQGQPMPCFEAVCPSPRLDMR